MNLYYHELTELQASMLKNAQAINFEEIKEKTGTELIKPDLISECFNPNPYLIDSDIVLKFNKYYLQLEKHHKKLLKYSDKEFLNEKSKSKALRCIEIIEKMKSKIENFENTETDGKRFFYLSWADCVSTQTLILYKMKFEHEDYKPALFENKKYHIFA